MKKLFKNLNHYARNCFDDFAKSPLNEIDAMIFSEISYFKYSEFIKKNKDKIRIKDIYDLSRLKRFLDRPAFKQDDLELMTSLCGNPRFNNIVISNFVKISNAKKSEQFSAITLTLPNSDIVVCFRGTDSTLTGWKEDFDMAYLDSVPSQIDARNYLKNILRKTRKRKIFIVGHSKGGNLAVYSYLSQTEIMKKKIERVYCFDGPSLSDHIKEKFNYKKYAFKIYKFVPEQSIIGMIYDAPENCIIVQSQSSYLSQHNMYNWIISGNELMRTNDITGLIKELDSAVNEWLKTSTVVEKEMFVETFYGITLKAGFENSVEMIKEKTKTISLIIEKYRELDKETKSKMSRLIKSLVSVVWASVRHKKPEIKELPDSDVEEQE